MAKLGEAVVYILGNQEGIEGALKDTEKKTTSWAGNLAGGVSKFLGGALVAGVAAAGAAIVGVGALAFNAGTTMDGAMDAIRISTGKTGEELQGLGDDFKAVFRSVPTDADTASAVIGELNRRLGLTGETLQDLAAPMIRMSDMLGGDAPTNAALFSRVMGDWGIANEDAAATLDKVFVAGQQTGVGVESLMQKVVQFGSPLRLMGFTLDDSIALFAKWEKEGVNSELVMGSLRIAAGKFAKEGVPLRESLLATFDSIQNNTDASAALAEGMDVFGARAGPDMVAAIREGRFSIDELAAAMEGSEGAILSAAAATDDFPQKLEVLRNKATVALAPVGLAVMDLAGSLTDTLGPSLEKAAQWLGDNLPGAIATLMAWWSGTLQPALATAATYISENVVPALIAMAGWLGENIPLAVATLSEFWTGTLQPALQEIWAFIQENLTPILAGLAAMLLVVVVPAFIAWAGAAATAAAATIAAMAPIIAPILAIGAAVGLLVAAWTNDWGGIRTTLTAFWEETAQPIFETVKAWLVKNIPAALAAARDWFVQAWENIKIAVTTVWTVLQGVWAALVNVFTVVIPGAATALWQAMSDTLAGIRETFSNVWNAILGFLRQLWDTIRVVVLTAIILVLQILGTNLEEIRLGWETVWNLVSGIATTVWNAIETTVETVFNAVKSFIETTLATLKTNWETAWNLVSGIATTVWNAIYTKVSTVVESVRAYVEEKVNALKTQWETAWNLVSGIATTVWNAIKAKVEEILPAIIAVVVEKAAALKASFIDPIVAAKDNIVGMLGDWTQVGRDLLDGLIDGVKERVQNLIDTVRGAIRDAVSQAKRLLGIESPSKVFATIGQNMMQGMAMGIDRNAFRPVLATAAAAERTVNNIVNHNYGITNWSPEPESRMSLKNLITALELGHA